MTQAIAQPSPRPFTQHGVIDVPDPAVHRVNMTIPVEGHYDVKLIDAATKRVKQHLQFPNLLCTAGLDALFQHPTSGFGSSMTELMTYFAVGTGSTAPAYTDTALTAELGRENNNGGNADVATAGFANGSNYYGHQVTRFFGVNEVNGNLTEVGTFNNSAGGIMLSHQLFLNGGSPTTIVKTNSDELVITYELRWYLPNGTTTGSFTLTGGTNNPYPVTVQPINTDKAEAWGYVGTAFGPLYGFGAVAPILSALAAEANTLLPFTGTTIYTPNVAADLTTEGSYTSGTFSNTVTFVWNPSSANFTTGIGSIFLSFYNTALSTGYGYQLSFGQKLPKNNTQKLTLIVTFSLARVAS